MPTKSTKKKAAPTKKTTKPATRKPAAKKSPAPDRAYAQRADFGKPIDGFFAKQPAALRPIVVALRALVEATVPSAVASLKWGMPVYEKSGGMVCAIGAHKAHVNLILSGPTDAFPDPNGLLDGTGKTGRHLTLRPGDTIPKAEIRGWLKIAAQGRG
jgi:hypothetical protein